MQYCYVGICYGQILLLIFLFKLCLKTIFQNPVATQPSPLIIGISAFFGFHQLLIRFKEIFHPHFLNLSTWPRMRRSFSGCFGFHFWFLSVCFCNYCQVKNSFQYKFVSYWNHLTYANHLTGFYIIRTLLKRIFEEFFIMAIMLSAIYVPWLFFIFVFFLLVWYSEQNYCSSGILFIFKQSIFYHPIVH